MMLCYGEHEWYVLLDIIIPYLPTPQNQLQASNAKIEDESCAQNRYSIPIPRTNSPTHVIGCHLIAHLSYMPLSWMTVARGLPTFLSCTICAPLKSHGLGNKTPFIRILLNSLNQVSIEHDPSGLKPLT